MLLTGPDSQMYASSPSTMSMNQGSPELSTSSQLGKCWPALLDAMVTRGWRPASPTDLPKLHHTLRAPCG